MLVSPDGCFSHFIRLLAVVSNSMDHPDVHRQSVIHVCLGYSCCIPRFWGIFDRSQSLANLGHPQEWGPWHWIDRVHYTCNKVHYLLCFRDSLSQVCQGVMGTLGHLNIIIEGKCLFIATVSGWCNLCTCWCLLQLHSWGPLTWSAKASTTPRQFFVRLNTLIKLT